MNLQLYYSHNIIEKSIAYIFVNTECNGLVYDDAESKGMKATKIFKEVLEFKEVAIFTN